MSTNYQIAAIQVAIHQLKDTISPELWEDTALPVVAAPGSWLRQVAIEHGQPEGDIPQYIHDCPVVQDDALDHPVLIAHDEKVYRIPEMPAAGGEEAPDPRTAIQLA